jgi:cytochrome c oxidase subunit 3
MQKLLKEEIKVKIHFKIMLNYISNSVYLNKKNDKSNVRETLLFKEQFKYLKTAHSYHLVDPSPWPLLASLGAFMLTSGLVLYMHKFIGGWQLLTTGFTLILYIMYTWWRDVVREATFEDQHSITVQKGLRLGMVLFIVSEIMFFFAFFWAFFHSSIAPTYNIGGVWPPKAITTINTFTIPLTNTFLLLTSGATVTWAHHALLARAKKHTLVALIFTILLATLFTCLQGLEYVNAPFNISDGVYGSCFYMATGFHGFHVFVGTVALIVSFIRIILNHFTNKHHFGFEAAIWYWHFVDVVWLFLFINVYWWSSK